MGWIEFALSLVVFLVLHAVPVRPRVKARIVGLIGARGFSLAYSLVSLVLLGWIIVAAGRAPFVELWPMTTVSRHLALTLMAIAVVILALGVARPNPLSFGGARNDTFDPAAPGIIGWLRHPLLAAIGIWALAHLIANGDLAHVILFGLFAGFAVLGMKIIDRRNRRLMGADWDRLSHTTRRLRVTRAGIIRVALAILLYVVILAGHGPVFGAYPLG